MCEAGEDTDFHMLPSMMHPIKTAPFYANLEGAAALCTAGGLQITPNSEVLDTEFNVIPGLYAIGNVSGSMFHGTYPRNLELRFSQPLHYVQVITSRSCWHRNKNLFLTDAIYSL